MHMTKNNEFAFSDREENPGFSILSMRPLDQLENAKRERITTILDRVENLLNQLQFLMNRERFLYTKHHEMNLSRSDLYQMNLDLYQSKTNTRISIQCLLDYLKAMGIKLGGNPILQAIYRNPIFMQQQQGWKYQQLITDDREANQPEVMGNQQQSITTTSTISPSNTIQPLRSPDRYAINTGQQQHAQQLPLNGQLPSQPLRHHSSSSLQVKSRNIQQDSIFQQQPSPPRSKQQLSSPLLQHSKQQSSLQQQRHSSLTLQPVSQPLQHQPVLHSSTPLQHPQQQQSSLLLQHNQQQKQPFQQKKPQQPLKQPPINTTNNIKTEPFDPTDMDDHETETSYSTGLEEYFENVEKFVDQYVEKHLDILVPSSPIENKNTVDEALNINSTMKKDTAAKNDISLDNEDGFELDFDNSSSSTNQQTEETVSNNNYCPDVKDGTELEITSVQTEDSIIPNHELVITDSYSLATENPRNDESMKVSQQPTTVDIPDVRVEVIDILKTSPIVIDPQQLNVEKQDSGDKDNIAETPEENKHANKDGDTKNSNNKDNGINIIDNNNRLEFPKKRHSKESSRVIWNYSAPVKIQYPTSVEIAKKENNPSNIPNLNLKKPKKTRFTYFDKKELDTPTTESPNSSTNQENHHAADVIEELPTSSPEQQHEIPTTTKFTIKQVPLASHAKSKTPNRIIKTDPTADENKVLKNWSPSVNQPSERNSTIKEKLPKKYMARRTPSSCVTERLRHVVKKEDLVISEKIIAEPVSATTLTKEKNVHSTVAVPCEKDVIQELSPVSHLLQDCTGDTLREDFSELSVVSKTVPVVKNTGKCFAKRSRPFVNDDGNQNENIEVVKNKKKRRRKRDEANSSNERGLKYVKTESSKITKDSGNVITKEKDENKINVLNPALPLKHKKAVSMKHQGEAERMALAQSLLVKRQKAILKKKLKSKKEVIASSSQQQQHQKKKNISAKIPLLTTTPSNIIPSSVTPIKKHKINNANNKKTTKESTIFIEYFKLGENLNLGRP